MLPNLIFSLTFVLLFYITGYEYNTKGLSETGILFFFSVQLKLKETKPFTSDMAYMFPLWKKASSNFHAVGYDSLSALLKV